MYKNIIRYPLIVDRSRNVAIMGHTIHIIHHKSVSLFACFLCRLSRSRTRHASPKSKRFSPELVSYYYGDVVLLLLLRIHIKLILSIFFEVLFYSTHTHHHHVVLFWVD